jgi:insulysin
LNSDYWRLSQVVRTNTNNKHPFSRFSTGNLQTLRDDPKKQGLNVRDELIKWYNAHYSANVMKLCVLGKGTEKKEPENKNNSFRLPNMFKTSF